MIENSNSGGFDKRTLIGVSLMILIAIWMMRPSEEKKNDDFSKSLSEDKKQISQGQEISFQEGEAFLADKDSAATLSPVILENDHIKIAIHRFGGQIERVTLKKYTDYTKKKLVQLIDESASLGLQFYWKKSGVQRDTRKILFEKREGIKGDNTSVVLRYNKEEGKQQRYIQYRYTLSEDYRLRLEISSQGVIWENDGGVSEFAFSFKGIRHEKGRENEDRYTEANYLYQGDKTDYVLSGEEEEERVSWFAYKQPFFSTVLRSPDRPFSKVDFSVVPLKESHYSKLFKTRSLLQVKEGEVQTLDFYFLPNDYKVLDRFDLTDILPLGWGIFGWVNRFAIIPLFDFLYDTGMNIGWVILLMTLIIKLLLSFVTYKNYVSSAKMKVIKPDITALNEKMAKSDNMKKQQALMQLYQKAGVNPMAGCLPALMQMPILIAVFRFFPQAIQLRQVEFLWMSDLSTYDSIYDLGFRVPLYGDHVSLMTILLAISTFFYSRFTGVSVPQSSQPGMPNMKVIMYLMPIMMVFWFNEFASGLSLYYFIANVTTLLQIFIIKNYIIDEKAIRQRIQENRKKGGKPKNRVQKRLDEMIKKSQRSSVYNKK